MFGFRRKQRPLLGIDIGSTAVKVVELANGRGSEAASVRAEALALEPLPPGVLVDKKIADIAEVGAALSTALKRCRTKTKRAAVAVAGSAVITKVLSLNGELSDAEMEAQIELEADQYVPYPLEEVNLDFDVLGPTEGASGMVDVLLAASRQENVDDRVAALELAGLSAEIVDIESNAIESACGLVVDPLASQSERLVGVADIGSSATTLHVLRNGQNIYSREQSFGAQHLIDEVQRREGLTPAESLERLQLTQGLTELQEAVLDPFQEALGRQLARALQFFFSASAHNRVDGLMLTGGVSTLPGLDRAVGERLAIPVWVADPFAEMALSEHLDLDLIRHRRGSMLIAVGLAMRRFR